MRTYARAPTRALKKGQCQGPPRRFNNLGLIVSSDMIPVTTLQNLPLEKHHEKAYLLEDYPILLGNKVCLGKKKNLGLYA